MINIANRMKNNLKQCMRCRVLFNRLYDYGINKAVALNQQLELVAFNVTWRSSIVCVAHEIDE